MEDKLERKEGKEVPEGEKEDGEQEEEEEEEKAGNDVIEADEDGTVVSVDVIDGAVGAVYCDMETSPPDVIVGNEDIDTEDGKDDNDEDNDDNGDSIDDNTDVNDDDVWCDD